MDRSAVKRISIAVLLIGIVLGMGVHYNIESDTHYPYPSSTDLKNSPGEYAGTQVFVFGTVEEINREEETARIRINTAGGPFIIKVTRFTTQRNVQPGGIVQVFGIFQGEYVIEANNVRVVNPAESSDIYKYIVSALAAGLIVVLFFRYWHMNIQTLSFEEK